MVRFRGPLHTHLLPAASYRCLALRLRALLDFADIVLGCAVQNVASPTFNVQRSTAITKSFRFGYILKLRAVLASWHALGSLKNAQQKILLRFASNLRIIHFWRICCVEMNRRPASAPRVRLCFASCSIPSKCMNNLREKVLGTHVKRDTPPNRLCPVVPCLLKKVSQTNHPPGQIASS